MVNSKPLMVYKWDPNVGMNKVGKKTKNKKQQLFGLNLLKYLLKPGPWKVLVL